MRCKKDGKLGGEKVEKVGKGVRVYIVIHFFLCLLTWHLVYIYIYLRY